MKKILSILLIFGLLLQSLFVTGTAYAVEETTVDIDGLYMPQFEDPLFKENFLNNIIKNNGFNLQAGDNGIPITTHGANYPTYSPDGNYIVYSNKDGSHYIYKKNSSDNSTGIQLGTKISRALVYTPDGNNLIYTNYNDGYAIYKKSANDLANGNGITNYYGYYPQVSPDGNDLYFVIKGSNTYKVYKKAINAPINDGDLIIDKEVYWISLSPDGNNLIYKDGANNLLYNRDLVNNTTKLITSVGGATFTYSPDGKYLIYTNESDGYKLYKKDPNTLSNGTAINSVSSFYPAFSPDGKYLVYTNISDGYKMYKIEMPFVTELGSITSTQTVINSNNENSVDFSISGIKDTDSGNTITYSYSFNNSTFTNLPVTNTSPISNGTYNFNLDLSSRPSGDITVYIRANDGSENSNVVSITLVKNNTPILDSLTSTQTDINLDNVLSLDLKVNGINDPDTSNTLSYSYSFDNIDFTDLTDTGISPISDGNYNFDLNLSGQDDGLVNIYVKTNDGYENSNTVSLALNKSATLLVPTAPSAVNTNNISLNGATYSWTDNSEGDNREYKHVIKDQDNNIIVDEIGANATNIIESGLTPNTSYQRKICAVNDAGEACSILINFTTKIEVTGGKTTTFDFAGIVINIVETLEMFKVEFNIGEFKINFSIEKI
ncbi:hypothetical protein A9Q91_03530 [Candidatus Gracilibacteria bacterium 28_42_T64]|nr:hypothetical protein A9Q91_03530 [Candidatus Gracilibacteria bacterium 28_42_T64]